MSDPNTAGGKKPKHLTGFKDYRWVWKERVRDKERDSKTAKKLR